MLMVPSVDATDVSQDVMNMADRLAERANSVPKSYQKLFGDLSGLIHARAPKQIANGKTSQIDTGV